MATPGQGPRSPRRRRRALPCPATPVRGRDRYPTSLWGHRRRQVDGEERVGRRRRGSEASAHSGSSATCSAAERTTILPGVTAGAAGSGCDDGGSFLARSSFWMLEPMPEPVPRSRCTFREISSWFFMLSRYTQYPCVLHRQEPGGGGIAIGGEKQRSMTPHSGLVAMIKSVNCSFMTDIRCSAISYRLI